MQTFVMFFTWFGLFGYTVTISLYSSINSIGVHMRLYVDIMKHVDYKLIASVMELDKNLGATN